MTRERRHLRMMLFLTTGLVFTALGVILYATDALRDAELDTVDTRFSIRGDEKPPSDLVVVEIDDVSFQELKQRWPFPRTTHADAIDRIAKDKPKAIAYDVQFTEPAKDEDEDFALLESIAAADNRVVLATTEVNEGGKTAILGGDAVLQEVGAKPANGLLPNDPGGVLRRVSYSIDDLKSFAVASTETATGRKVDPDRLDGDGSWIDYYGPPRTIERISFSRVAQDKVKPGTFRDKVVVVGPSAPSLQDVHPTSTTGDEGEMAGVEIQANAIDTVRRGAQLQSAPAGLDVALIVLLGLVAPVASMRLSPMRALALALGVGVIFLAGAQLAFNGGTVLAIIYPLGTLVVSAIAALAIHYITAAFERERIRDMFSRFVPENVVDDVLASADGLRLGGVQREGTVMFSDLRGFTSFAEAMPPDQVIEVLNRYLTEMSDAILEHGGTLVAYMGDGIMAVFGAPVQQDDHADRALAAARDMLGERLERFNEFLRSEELSEGFRMGVGLNSGQVMSGNVGSEKRLEYTAIGDTTNTAARLEGMTKGTPHMLFMADSTRAMLREEPADLVYVDEFEVRGRAAKVKIWSVPGAEEGPPAASREDVAAQETS